ncbi:MAG: YraN family protein [Bacteroidota bacterium]
MATHNETGKKGEELAANYLAEHGFEIIEKNFRWKRYEIDLIVKKEPFLVFVEVKTKTNISYGMPEDDVTPQKASQVMAAAEEYIYATGWKKEIRFDIISIIMKGQQVNIEHIVDAFY